MPSIGAICVGGPCGGQRKSVLHGARFRVAEIASPVLTEQLAFDPKPTSFDVTYVLQDIIAEGGHGWVVWVPQGQTAEETLTILLTTYEAQQRKTRP